ncbi:MAG: hypothetical protein COA78_09530 [Blastopirellula sp.]|nr:MAG: hypothetical protein COA78_09530 [Blastopirellula sp.]
MDQPTVEAIATFLPHDEGGRSTLLTFKSEPWYRPHIVIQDSAIRTAEVDENGMNNENYLGVEFIDGPEHLQFGHRDQYQLRLFYSPAVDYSAVIVGAEFTIREGARIVGFGTVLSRSG